MRCVNGPVWYLAWNSLQKSVCQMNKSMNMLINEWANKQVRSLCPGLIFPEHLTSLRQDKGLILQQPLQLNAQTHPLIPTQVSLCFTS